MKRTRAYGFLITSHRKGGYFFVAEKGPLYIKERADTIMEAARRCAHYIALGFQPVSTEERQMEIGL